MDSKESAFEDITAPSNVIVYQPSMFEAATPMSRYEAFAQTMIRFKYSKASMVIYGITAFLGLLSMIWSFLETCPSGLFILFELMINILLIVDVLVTLLAFGKVRNNLQ
jgi:uncharacterized membrane protein